MRTNPQNQVPFLKLALGVKVFLGLLQKGESQVGTPPHTHNKSRISFQLLPVERVLALVLGLSWVSSFYYTLTASEQIHNVLSFIQSLSLIVQRNGKDKISFTSCYEN